MSEVMDLSVKPWWHGMCKVEPAQAELQIWKLRSCQYDIDNWYTNIWQLAYEKWLKIKEIAFI